MSRADRLLELSALLKARQETTVASLAHDLDVSRRTVFRDLSTLREQGWQIEADTGPGGGVRLDRDSGLMAVKFSFDEIIGLWIAARLSASVTSVLWGASARSALNKLLATLPQERRSSLRRMLKRVVVGQPASPAVRETLGPTQAGLSRLVEQAFAQGRCLGFSYTDRRGRQTRRTAEIHGLFVELPAWYLLTIDRGLGETRLFRFDRIRQARLLTARFDPEARDVYREWLSNNGYASSPKTSDSIDKTHL